MALNWNPLIILMVISGSITLIIALLVYFIFRQKKKIRSLFYIKLGLLFFGISTFLDGISNLFMSIIIAQISAILLILGVLCFSIGINYTIKETYISIHFIIFSCLGVLICYLAFQPGAIQPITEYGSLSLKWNSLFGLLTDIISAGVAIIVFYWGFKTWKNSPFLIKKDALIFFIGISTSTIFTSIILLFRADYHFLSNILFCIFWNIGIFIFMYAIIREPKVLYILPFTIYRILVKDKDGFPLFDHDWSESDISEVMFTGFINAIQVISEEVMKIGGLVDINLEEGILILHESSLITVGLVASKSSKLLKDALINFSGDFEQKFERQLKQRIKDKSKYDPAYLLIDKYFSNFPFRLIKSKKQPLLLPGKSEKVPFELESKLRNIFPDMKEYESLIAEIAKSPAGLSEEFLNLYEDLKQEMDQLHGNNAKKLKNKQS